MAERETSRYIDETAADWVARLDREPLSEEEARTLDAWLSGDPRRRGAMLRADAVSMLSESARALGPQFDPRQFASPDKLPARFSRLTRRKAFAWAGGALAASIVALGVSWPASGAITTGLGEVRLVTLDDGSTVVLNTQTSIRVRYSESERRVDVLDGEAYFTIVPGDRRPFFVDVGDARLRILRAAFRVRKLGTKPVDILVDQGNLAIGRPGSPAPALMSAQTRLALPPTLSMTTLPPPQPVTVDQVSRELAWREGKIAFEGDRLDHAAAEFGRYSNTRIEIRDSSLAGEPITGLFAAGDPAGFSRAIASVFDAHMETKGNAILLSRGTARD